ncbi:MAG: hypothetical protein ACYSW8_17305 [Planctomycetota bacterium]|jgi:hypothetical protein
MRGLYGIICLLLIGICAGTTYVAIDTETRATRWEKNVESAENAYEVARLVRSAQQYSLQLVEATRMLANENGLLCERDAKNTEVVAAFDDENRRLKTSLVEACDRLEEQQEEIDDLVDENEQLSYQVDVLERAVENLESAIEAIEAADVGDTAVIEPNPALQIAVDASHAACIITNLVKIFI